MEAPLEVNFDATSNNSSDSLHTIPDLDDFDINGYEDPSTITSLMQAARSGSTQAIEDSLRYRKLLNNANNQGLTALHYAVIGKHSDIVKLLVLQEEINVDAQDWDGMTPLMHACQKRVPVDIIRNLLENNCNVELKDNQKMTALWHALIGDKEEFAGFDGTVVEMLTEHGADIHGSGIAPYHETPVSYVLTHDELPPVVKAEVVGALLYYGADPTISLDLIIKITDAVLYDMVIPYFSTCDIEHLMKFHIRTTLALWRVQSPYNKLRFAQMFQHSHDKLMQALLESILHCEGPPAINDLDQLISFLYALLESEEMYEVMYTDNAGKAIQSEILTRIFNHFQVSDQIAGDILRISLCNCNYLNFKAYTMLVNHVVNPNETVKVLEDFDVIICNTNSFKTPPWANQSWQMYLDISNSTLNNENYTAENAQKFFKFRQRETPSLLEQCRNVVRDYCNYNSFTSIKPYNYATRIKALACPKVIHEILLLRKPIY